MNQVLKESLLFVGGLIIGSFVTYKVLNRQMEDTIEEEVEVVKQYAKEKIKKAEEQLLYLNSAEERGTDLKSVDSLVTKHYTNITEHYAGVQEDDEYDEDEDAEDYAVPGSEWFEDIMTSEQMKSPFIISYEQFDREMPHFSKISVVYYEADNTFAYEENDEIIDDPRTILGDGHEYFGCNIDDPDVVYIRNYMYGSDYELTRFTGSYSESILGAYEEKQETRKQKKEEDTEEDDW